MQGVTTETNQSLKKGKTIQNYNNEIREYVIEMYISK